MQNDDKNSRFNNNIYDFYYYKYFIRIIDEYYFKLEYRTKQFIRAIYCGYRQVIDKSK